MTSPAPIAWIFQDENIESIHLLDLVCIKVAIERAAGVAMDDQDLSARLLDRTLPADPLPGPVNPGLQLTSGRPFFGFCLLDPGRQINHPPLRQGDDPTNDQIDDEEREHNSTELRQPLRAIGHY